MFQPSHVSLRLMSLDGRLVRSWDQGELPAGERTAWLDLQGQASGLYFLVLVEDPGTGPRARALFKLALVR